MIFEGGLSVDAAELQRVANRLGIAHSTGYPLFTMLGYGTARMGAALGLSPYTAITFFSSVCSAVALVVFFYAALRLGNVAVAFAATMVLAFSNIFWHISTITEVQALQALLTVGTLLLLFLYLEDPRRFWTLAGMAVLAGLGLSNHRMIVLLFPVIGVGMLVSQFWKYLTWRQFALLILLGLLPLTSHLYIYWRATDPLVVYGTRLPWIPIDLSTQDMTNLIRGTFQDGQGLEANIVYDRAVLGERLRLIAERTIAEITLPGAILGLVGLVVLTVRQWRVGLVLWVYVAVLVVFLVGWHVDVKAQIYYYLMVIPLLFGIVALFVRPLNLRRLSPLC